MRKLLPATIVGVALILGLSTQAGASGRTDTASPKHDASHRAVPVFAIDSANYPGATHIIYLEAKDRRASRDYTAKVNRLIDGIASQPGFIASMTMSNIDRRHITVYYQFKTVEQWQAARANKAMEPLAGDVQSSSSRFDDYALNPREQVTLGATPVLQHPDGYISYFHLGDGVATNEAVVTKGRTQSELTTLMRRAGTVNNINESEGFIDFTFHEAADGSRNVNLLHWSNVFTMSSAAITDLIEPLLNNKGFSGTSDGWGEQGPGLIGVTVSAVTRIQNGAPGPHSETSGSADLAPVAR